MWLFALAIVSKISPAGHVDQECAVFVFGQTYDFGHRVWHGIELWRTPLPSPKPRSRSGPQIAPGVLIQGVHLFAETSILPVATSVTSLNRAQFSRDLGDVHTSRSDPYRSFTVLKKRRDRLAARIFEYEDRPPFVTSERQRLCCPPGIEFNRERVLMLQPPKT